MLGYLAASMYSGQPPIPGQVLDAEGKVLFTSDDVIAGQNIFQKFGLMQFGTIFGHGAYLGPDFTAQYLHLGGRTSKTICTMDIIFIVGGIFPVVYLAIRMFLNRNKPVELPAGTAVEKFSEKRDWTGP